MKKIIVIAIAFVMLFAMTACSAQGTIEAAKVAGIPTHYVGSVYASELNAFGYTHFECDEDTVLHFSASDNEDAQWLVYVLNSEFIDDDWHITEMYVPYLVNSGDLDVFAGQYVYIFCSVNCTNCEKIPADLCITFTAD